ncbi:MAG: PLP-dependent aminotransferase family protein [Chloroflexi bacterium]|nr:PLP-dependent aminotransferase family protein [Chloroflexota bacterium]MDA8187273.1 PLP-dependent aminotransferase family protein [Dehalococcoidales bacterium]
MKTIDDRLATRTTRMNASAIREILKVTQSGDILSLAGGLPAPEAFPVDIVKGICQKVLEENPVQALQYGPSEGLGPLRQALVEYAARLGISASLDEVLVFTGSQQVLDLLGKLLVNTGDNVVVENPTYLGALQSLNAYQPNYIPWPTDDEGAIPDALEEILRKNRVKLIYAVPNFQNPTGRTLGLERRRCIARILVQYEALLVEDDPYGRLRYSGTDVPTIKSMAPDNVVYLSSFSKVLSPGLRLGWVVAPHEISRWLVIAKQGADLHTGSLPQAIAAEFVAGGYLDRHLSVVLDLYRRRLAAILEALECHLNEVATWTRPQGGMFVWVTLPAVLDAEEVYWKAIERKVAFVPGKFFHTDGVGNSTMRLNFSNTHEDRLGEAIERLAGSIKDVAA